MIYTNSTTNYTKIDTQKSVHFAVSRTETRLKMHQTCIWNTGHMQSIAGPVHASAVWTDEMKTTKITVIVPIGYSLFADHRSVPSFGPEFFWLTYFCSSSVCALISWCNWWYPLDITSIGIGGTPLVPGMSMSGTSGRYYVWQKRPRGRAVSAPDFGSRGRGFESRWRRDSSRT